MKLLLCLESQSSLCSKMNASAHIERNQCFFVNAIALYALIWMPVLVLNEINALSWIPLHATLLYECKCSYWMKIMLCLECHCSLCLLLYECQCSYWMKLLLFRECQCSLCSYMNASAHIEWNYCFFVNTIARYAFIWMLCNHVSCWSIWKFHYIKWMCFLSNWSIDHLPN